jgi:hypothetical protein
MSLVYIYDRLYLLPNSRGVRAARRRQSEIPKLTPGRLARWPLRSLYLFVAP